MRTENNKVLYENIMAEVSRIVERRINESNNEFSMENLNNPEFNLKICQKYPDVFKCRKSPDESYIGTILEIRNAQDSNDAVDVTIYGKTFVNLVVRVAVIFLAPLCANIHRMPDLCFDVELNREFKKMWKKVWNGFSSEKQDEIDGYAQALFF